jgi:hypothetical protein
LLHFLNAEIVDSPEKFSPPGYSTISPKVYSQRLQVPDTDAMKSQENAFRAFRKAPAKKPKEVVVQAPAKPSGVKKNASRNERRKAARKVAALLKAQRPAVTEHEQESTSDKDTAKGETVDES